MEMDMEAFFRAVEGDNEGKVSWLLDADPTLLERADEEGKRPLMVAAMHGQLGVVKLLMQRGATMTAICTLGTTALHRAAEQGHEDVVAWLLGQGAHTTRRALDGGTPFMLACQECHVSVARLLLQHTGNQAMQEVDDEGWTALHHAASWADEETVTFLLGRGAQASSRDKNGGTPLMYACGEGQLRVAKVLLQHVGAQALQETDSEGLTALHSAGCGGCEDMVTFLISEGAQANSRNANGATPLMQACARSCLGVVRLLLQHMGPQALQDTDNEGFTALHRAAVLGHEEVVSFLINEGAQANGRDSGGMTLLLWAGHTGHMGVVRVLLEHVEREALHETDNDGSTALHLAAYGGHEETASFLISKGAQTSSRDVYGGTPFMFACEAGRLGVVRLLVQHTGQQALYETDAKGMTALHWAVQRGRGEVVRLLLVAGADPTVTDNEGRTPRALADEDEDEDQEEEEEGIVERGSRAACMAAFEWYACELERRRVLHRATCLRKACTAHQDLPTSRVPTYLMARVAAGHALPGVEVVLSQPQAQEHEEQAGINGDTQALDEGGNAEEAEAGEEEMHAVLTYVLEALNEDLVIELLEGFPL